MVRIYKRKKYDEMIILSKKSLSDLTDLEIEELKKFRLIINILPKFYNYISNSNNEENKNKVEDFINKNKIEDIMMQNIEEKDKKYAIFLIEEAKKLSFKNLEKYVLKNKFLKYKALSLAQSFAFHFIYKMYISESIIKTNNSIFDSIDVGIKIEDYGDIEEENEDKIIYSI